MAVFNFLKKKEPEKPASKKKIEKKIERKIEKKVVKEIIPKTEPIRKASPKRDSDAISRLLKEPHISEKATDLSENGKYIFRVYKDANKSEIKKAVAGLYGVVVKEVNIINIKTKTRILRGRKGEKPGYKKAIVTLEKGHKIEILPH